MAYSLLETKVRTVIYSYSQVESNTYALVYDKDTETYLYSLTETKVFQYLPYIIYSLTKTLCQSYLQLNAPKRKAITPEKLIGIVCGSVAIFFIVLTIIMVKAAMIILLRNSKSDLKNLFIEKLIV